MSTVTDVADRTSAWGPGQGKMAKLNGISNSQQPKRWSHSDQCDDTIQQSTSDIGAGNQKDFNSADSLISNGQENEFISPALRCLSDYAAKCCKLVQRNLKQQTEPTELELLQFMHGFVVNLKALLQNLFDEVSIGSASQSQVEDAYAVKRRIIDVFRGLYDFDKNCAQTILPGKREKVDKSEGNRRNNKSNDDHKLKRNKTQSDYHITQAERGGNESDSDANSSSEESDGTSKKSGTIDEVSESDSDNELLNDQKSCNLNHKLDQSDVNDSSPKGHPGGPQMRNRFQLAHLLFIMSRLERMLCAGHEVLASLAVDDLHHRVRQYIARSGKSLFTGGGGLHNLYNSHSSTTHVTNVMNVKNGGPVSDPTKVLTMEIFVPHRIILTVTREADHHMCDWKFEHAGKWRYGQALFWPKSAVYEKD